MFINLGNDVAGLPPDYEARLEETFGGLALDRDGLPVPNIMGRLCEWTPPRPPATFASYGDYKAAARNNYYHYIIHTACRSLYNDLKLWQRLPDNDC